MGSFLLDVFAKIVDQTSHPLFSRSARLGGYGMLLVSLAEALTSLQAAQHSSLYLHL